MSLWSTLELRIVFNVDATTGCVVVNVSDCHPLQKQNHKDRKISFYWWCFSFVSTCTRTLYTCVPWSKRSGRFRIASKKTHSPRWSVLNGCRNSNSKLIVAIRGSNILADYRRCRHTTPHHSQTTPVKPVGLSLSLFSGNGCGATRLHVPVQEVQRLCFQVVAISSLEVSRKTNTVDEKLVQARC